MTARKLPKFVENVRCAYCGIEEGSDGAIVEMHSGTYECTKCWYWRKLDGPAARHWAQVAVDFLANVDLYDVTKFFPAAGLTSEETGVMLDAARKLADYAVEQVRAHS